MVILKAKFSSKLLITVKPHDQKTEAVYQLAIIISGSGEEDFLQRLIQSQQTDGDND